MMKDFQQRVKDEKIELDGRIERLLSFMEDEIFDSLPLVERDLMFIQCKAMREYSAILGKRISRF